MAKGSGPVTIFQLSSEAAFGCYVGVLFWVMNARARARARSPYYTTAKLVDSLRRLMDDRAPPLDPSGGARMTTATTATAIIRLIAR